MWVGLQPARGSPCSLVPCLGRAPRCETERTEEIPTAGFLRMASRKNVVPRRFERFGFGAHRVKPPKPNRR
eukprot:6275101-Prymnesium_polylepis.1